MGSEKTATRRRYGADAKARVLAECDVAAKAVNTEFVPVALPAQPDPAPVGDIRVELRRGAVAMTVVWPVSAATEFAVWMRELLR